MTIPPPQNSSREFDNFEELLDRLLGVPNAAVRQRIKEYHEQAARNPRRRGPKPRNKDAVRREP
jgi:hypothetical protein